MSRSYEDKVSEQVEIKFQVALKIWDSFITGERNPRIGIDAGSSSEIVAFVIRSKIDEILLGGESTPIVFPAVFTHNLGAWEWLRDLKDMDVYLLGGRYSAFLNAVIEPGAYETQIADWYPSTTIIATSGINKDGLYCSNKQDEAPVKTALAQKEVARRIIICDHTKIGDNDVRRFVNLDDLKNDNPEVFLVTDNVASGVVEGRLQKKYDDTLEAFRAKHGDQSIVFVESSPESQRLAKMFCERKGIPTSAVRHRDLRPPDSSTPDEPNADTENANG